jgi:hypothetical protein
MLVGGRMPTNFQVSSKSFVLVWEDGVETGNASDFIMCDFDGIRNNNIESQVILIIVQLYWKCKKYKIDNMGGVRSTSVMLYLIYKHPILKNTGTLH